MSLKKKIDIEKLLRWAIMDELPKGRPVSAGLWDSMMQLGCRVQTSRVGGGDGLGFVDGEPHPDANAVAQAVRALPADYKIGARRCYELLGVYAACDPLAVRAMESTPFNLPALVMRCAILKERMPWDCGKPQMRPVLYNSERGGRPHPIILGLDDDGLGLVAVKADKHGRWPLDRAPRGHVHYEEPSIGDLLEMRAEYSAWHFSLVTLARELAGKLAEHDVLPPACAAEPWNTGEADVGAVHVVKSDLSLSKLPLSPRRKAAGPPIEAAIETETRLNRAARARDRRRREKPESPAGQRIS